MRCAVLREICETSERDAAREEEVGETERYKGRDIKRPRYLKRDREGQRDKK